MSNLAGYYSIEDAEDLVQSFLNCTMDKWDWTHEAHLVAGLYVVTHHGDQSLSFMRNAISRFNESVGTANTDTSGYHETLTYFWLNRIREACTDTDGSLSWDQRTLNYLLVNQDLTNRNVWLEHYSEEQIKSVRARKEVI